MSDQHQRTICPYCRRWPCVCGRDGDCHDAGVRAMSELPATLHNLAARCEIAENDAAWLRAENEELRRFARFVADHSNDPAVVREARRMTQNKTA